MYVLYRGEVSGGDGVEILTRFLPLLSYSFLTPGHLFPDFHLQLPNLAGGGPVFYLQIKKSCIIFWKCWSFRQFSNYEIWNMCMPTSSLIFLPWCLCHSWNRTLQQCLLNVMCYYSFFEDFWPEPHSFFLCYKITAHEKVTLWTSDKTSQKCFLSDFIKIWKRKTTDKFSLASICGWATCDWHKSLCSLSQTHRFWLIRALLLSVAV